MKINLMDIGNGSPPFIWMKSADYKNKDDDVHALWVNAWRKRFFGCQIPNSCVYGTDWWFKIQRI